MRIGFLSLALAATLFAQSPNVGGPLTGFVVTSGAVRPVLGIPGAARLGEPVLTESAAMTVSSTAGAALECAEGELRRIDLYQGTRQILAALSPCPDALSFSPSAESAVLVFRSQQAVRLFAKSQLSHPIDVPGVAACAISDDGARLLCATEFGLMALTSAGASMRLLENGAAPAAFLQGSREAVVADASRVYLLRNGWTLEPLADFDNASSVAILGDNDAAVVASRQSGKVAAVHLRTRSIETLDAPVQADTLNRLSGGVVQILTTAPGPTWLLARTGETTRIFFVPQPEGSNE